MKKVLVLLSALVAMTMALTSCVTLNYQTQESGETLKFTQLAVKDYNIIGPTTVVTTVTEKKGLLSQKKDGSEVVYPLLLDEAVKMGGQDVINVRVAKKEESETKLFGAKNGTYTYTATALVIAYTNKNLETKAVYDSDGKLIAITGPVIESSKTGMKASGLVGKVKLFKLFKRR